MMLTWFFKNRPKLSKKHYFVASFFIFYILFFAVYYTSIGNPEFMMYLISLVIIAVLIYLTLNFSQFDTLFLFGLTLWGLFHLLGGALPVNGSVAYDYVFIHLFTVGEDPVLKYDQVLHMFGFVLVGYYSYYLFARNALTGVSKTALVFCAFFFGMGLGAFNEVLEFSGTVFFPLTNVGGYVNTALDLVANGVGALLGALFACFRN